jgi:O-succinylbenzoic acid--CoA ligase
MKTSVIDIGLKWSVPELTQALSAGLRQDAPSLVIINTSGSTGINKRVQLSTAAIAASAKLSNAAVGAATGDIWSLLLPTNHIAGINVLARAIILDSKIVGVDQPADFTAIVPTQLHRALTGDAQLLHHLKNCKAVLVGASATSKTLLAKAFESGINVITTYGMTETSGGCVYNNLPLPGVLIAISEDGLIKINGPILAQGYEGQEDLWSQRFKDGWFTSNDLGEIIDDQIFVIGRADDVIISGGEKISLISIERELAENFPDTNFLATSIPDSEWGDKLCLLADGEFDQNKVSQLLHHNLGKQFVPKDYLIVAAIPQIGVGKPDRVKASKLFQDKQR